MELSFNADELFEEFKVDYKDLGNIEVYAFLKEMDDLLFLVGYDFIVEQVPLSEKEQKEYTAILRVPLRNVGKVLEIESNFFSQYEDIDNAIRHYLF